MTVPDFAGPDRGAWALAAPANGEAIDITYIDHVISNASGCTRIWVGTGGTLVVRLAEADEDLTYTNIPDGTEFVGNVSIVRRTGTTCSDMVADWPELRR